MWRILSLVIIIQMAAVAKVRGIHIVPFMTGKAVWCNGGMCAVQLVIIVMDRESRRLPVGFGRMAGLTGIWDPDTNMIGI